MNRRFFKLPENPTPQAANAFRYATIILWSTIAALPFEGYLAIRSGSWQLWAGAGIILGVFIASYFSLRLIQNGKTERAVQVMIFATLIGVMLNPFLIANIGLGLAFAIVMMTTLIASQASTRPGLFAIIGFIAATITILLDLFLPANRLVVPALELFTPVIAGAVVLMLVYRAVRGFRDFDLRVKMITVIISIVMISVVTIAFAANRTLSTNLTEGLGANMYDRANSVSVGVVQIIDREVSLLKAFSVDAIIENMAETASREVLTQAEIEQRDKQWRAAHAEDNNADLLILRVQYNRASTQLRYFQRNFRQNAEVFLTNQQGVNVAATDRTSDYYQADEEWWQAAYQQGLYLGPPEYDESTKSTAMIIAIAIRDNSDGEFLGVLRTTVTLDSLAQAFGSGTVGETGQAVLYMPGGQELTVEQDEDGRLAVVTRESGFQAEFLDQTEETYFEADYDGVPMLVSQYRLAQTSEGTRTSETVINEAELERAQAIADLNLRVIVFQQLAEALEPVNLQTRNIVLLALLVFVVGTFSALALAQIISGPIIRLTAAAEQVTAGDLSVQASVETGDEIGTLARTFNTMTAQLRDLIGTLEQRVADRTKALATSTEVSRNLSTILNERQLIIEVVEQIKKAFDYYHVHIYLQDERSGDLLMAGGTGEVGASLLGSGHKVLKGKGLVGRAAHNNLPVLVSDTTQDPGWLPNPLLPETKSEAAIPIASANAVLGVLDVQDNKVDGLQQEDVDLLQSIANQVAIALLNARAYVDIQQRAEREARITSIGMKIKSTTSIDAALQATARELGRTLGVNDIRVILEAPGTVTNQQEPE